MSNGIAIADIAAVLIPLAYSFTVGDQCNIRRCLDMALCLKQIIQIAEHSVFLHG
jgi:hypothetical protein